jgi:hypothetical protein
MNKGLLLLTALAALPLVHCNGSSAETPATSHESVQGSLAITSPLALSEASVAPGDTVTGTITYQNTSSAAVTLNAIVIAARPPGGTHGGGPYDDFEPYAAPLTLPPGASTTVTATRTFAASDPVGTWDVYPTYQDASGAWFDGPDTSLPVGTGGGAGPVQEGPLTVSTALVLSEATAHAGDTVTASVTFTNSGSAAVVMQNAVIAGRPPGGTHGGGPYDDFAPTAAARTLAPGQSLTVTATRTFAGGDPTGAWDVYPTFEDGSGAWHDGPDSALTLVSSASAPDAGTTDGGASGGGGGSGNPITAPLAGNVTPGTWQAGDLEVPGVTLPSGKAFHYDYLLPANYDPSFTYPILVHEHEDEEGDAWYDGDNGDPLYLASASGADGWYNNVAWRTAYPCIVILPYADQTANGTDGNDAVENFGGWVNTGTAGSGTSFSGDSGPNVFAVAGLVQEFLAKYSANPQKVYITGDSLGGIGSWYMISMYNRINGPSGRLFTAALPFAGVMEIHGYGSGPSAADVAALKGVPVFAVSGGQDGTSVPADWNEPLWRALAGNDQYPGPASGAQAGGSSFRYLEDPGLGHDVWDTYRPLPAGKPMYDWLFAQ